MTALQDFRGAHPEYGDMPDQDLADALHSKYYSDIPQDQYYSKIGYQKPDTSFLGQAANFTDKYISNPSASIASNFEQGLMNIGPGVQNLARIPLNAIPGVNIPKVQPYDFAPHDLGALIGGAGSLAIPFSTFGRTASAVSEIPSISNALSKLPEFMNNPIFKNITSGSLMGGVASPGSPVTGAAGGALLGAASPLLPVASGAVSAYSQNKLPEYISKFLPSNLSSDQLSSNLAASQGTNTSLGHVIGSPMLGKTVYENTLGQLPLSGAVGKMQQTGNQVIDKGNAILSNLIGSHDPAEVNQTLQGAMKDVYTQRELDKNNNYNSANFTSDQEGLEYPSPKFQKILSKYQDALDKSGVFQSDPDLEDLFNRFKKYKDIGISSDPYENVHGFYQQDSNYPSLKEVGLLKGKLNGMAKSYTSSPDPSDRGMGKILGNLSSSLKEDINDTIESSGSENLQSQWKNAEKSYSQNFSPMIDKTIYQYAKGGKDPDLLMQDFIKTGPSSDRAGVLKKLIDVLPEDKKGLPAYAYLSRAMDEEGNVNPLQMKSLLNNKMLGPNQKNILFNTPGLQDQLKNYSNLVDMNKNSLNVMNNPPTGKGGVTNALASISMAPFGAISRPLTNMLTSEGLRNRIVNEMIKRKETQ